ncbi:hypothetical protein D9M71_681490 [compost metagenome]
MKVASTTNTPSRISQHQNNCGEAQAACSDRPASTMPRKPLPASPMKILAGGKFQNRKPSVAAASNSGSAINCGAPAKAESSTMPRQAVTASTLAIPSMPSMKLYRLSIHTL